MNTPATLSRLAIVVREDAFDRILTPLTFALTQASAGVRVDILFTLWSVRLLTADGLRSVTMSAEHRHEETWLKERLARDGDPLEIRGFLGMLKQTGNVGLWGCALAAATFDVIPGSMIPEADGVLDPGRFLIEKALAADHCQYF